MRITILGTGNAAWVLGTLFRRSGHEIVQVFGRDKDRAKTLAREWNALAVMSPEEIHSNANLYLVAVSDKAISEVARRLSIGNELVVHTAGSVPMGVLDGVSANYGVLYPLQSLRAGRIPQNEIPILVNANSPDCLTMLTDFATTISKLVYPCSDEQRMKLHLAAVVLNNFSNYLYVLAEDYCEREAVPFRLLHPLLRETVNRLDAGPASEFQTGPAYRHDQGTMNQHIEALKKYPALSGIYKKLSEDIEAWFGRS